MKTNTRATLVALAIVLAGLVLVFYIFPFLAGVTEYNNTRFNEGLCSMIAQC